MSTRIKAQLYETFDKYSDYISCWDGIVNSEFEKIEVGVSPGYYKKLTLEYYESRYHHNKVLFECMNYEYYCAIKNIVDKYFLDDNQFPPDFPKLTRLHAVCNIFKPTLVIEWGSGISSAILRDYLMMTKRARGITVEQSEEWLACTAAKVENVGVSNNHQMVLWRHFEAGDIALKISKKDRILILLDSKMADTESEDFYGMKSLSSIFPQELGNKLVCIIDARSPAVLKANLLARKFTGNFTLKSNSPINLFFDSFPKIARKFSLETNDARYARLNALYHAQYFNVYNSSGTLLTNL